MTRTILLSSFVLALMSAQATFAAATSDDHATAATSDDHHTISLESIKIKTVNDLHPEAATPKKGAEDEVGCNAMEGPC